MAPNQSSSPFPLSSSSLSSASQVDFSAVAKAFSFILMKLDSSNYILWKAQILTTIRAFDLVSFLNKTTPPIKIMPDPDGEDAVINPEYLSWIESDQLLLG